MKAFSSDQKKWIVKFIGYLFFVFAPGKETISKEHAQRMLNALEENND